MHRASLVAKKLAAATAVVALGLFGAINASANPALANLAETRDDSLAGIKASLANETALTNVILGVGAEPNTRNLVWYTDSENSGAPIVELITADKLTNGAFPERGATRFTGNEIATHVAGQTQSRGFEANVNKITFKDLKPGTSYAYRIGNGDTWLGQWQFTTEQAGDKWSFFFTGDPQIGASAGHKGTNPMEPSWQADTWGWNETLKLATKTYPNIHTHVSAGDQVESSRTSQPNSSRNQTEREYLGYSYPQALKTLQNAPTLGNHDYYTGGRATYQEHYNHPNFDQDTWNSWWAENNVLFLHMNTEFTGPDAFEAHDAWMTKVLAEQGGKYAHHAVVMHRPLYSTGPHSTSSATDDVRTTFVPLLHKHNISVLLTGHDHSYARSHIVNNFYPGTPGNNWKDQTGEVINLGTGENAPKEVFLTDNQLVSIVANSASGSKFYDINEADQPYLAVKNQEYLRNYTVVDVDACSFTYRTHRADGSSEHEVNSIVDEVRVNVPNARPTLDANPEPLTITQSEASSADLLQGVEHSMCDADKFPVEITGDVDASKLDTPQTVKFTIAAGTEWEVTAEREITVVKDPSISADKASYAQGDTVNFNIDGFAPQDEVKIELHSTPQEVATVTADANGQASGSFVLAADTTPGEHQLVAIGASGKTASADIAVVAKADDKDGKTDKDAKDGTSKSIPPTTPAPTGSADDSAKGLATTGSEDVTAIAVFAVAALLGGFTLYSTRRRNA